MSMFEKKLGVELAQKVLKAFEKDPQHFGFIKISAEELAELVNLYSPASMPLHRDVYSFRAGVWVVMIVVHDRDWVEVTILNPYDVTDHHTTTNL